MDFVQHVLNGLLQGCILALIGLGFSLVWGILNIINLAHAAFIMLAAYLTYFLWAGLGMDPFTTLPLTMSTLFLTGYVLQRYVINLVMGASILTTFLLTFGFESLLINLALRFFSADTRQTRPFYANASFPIGPLQVPYTQIGAVVVALLLTLVLRTARSILGVAGEIWTTGKLVANNTIHIPLLVETNRLAGNILNTAQQIVAGADAIEQHAEGCPGCPACVLSR